MNRNQEQSSKDVRSRLAKCIQARREQLRMTQAQLAKAAGLNASQSISDIEREKRDIKAVELAAIAKALHLSLSDLFGADEEEEEAPVVAWRKKSVDPADATAIAQSRAYFLRLCENYALAESWVELENRAERVHLPVVKAPKQSPDHHWARQVAETIRSQMGLGSIPSLELAQALEERYGMKIFFIDEFPGSALCTHGSSGMAIALKRKEVPWRRNYSLAHELFHLLTWDYLGPETIVEDDGMWSVDIEKSAEAFASSLLLPEESVRASFQRHRVGDGISWNGLIDIAREFVVSTEALLWRLVSLNLFTTSQTQTLLANLDFRVKDRETFPLWEKPNLYPDRFYRLLEQAYLQGEVSMGRVAEMTELDLATTHYWLSQLDSEEDNGVEQAEQLVRLA